MTEAQAVALFKCLADKSRLQILKSLMQEDMYAERLAERLGLTPATISFHMKKLEEAGAVASRREQYYTVYSLKRQALEKTMLDILAATPDEAQQDTRDEAYRSRVLNAFFEYGRLKSIPAQQKKKRICLEKIAGDFEIGREYSEKEVNEVLLRYHEDYCTLRRWMADMGIMDRSGAVYVRRR